MQRLATLVSVAGLTLVTGCCLPQMNSGRSFYPVGIYGVNSTNDFVTVKNAGFNLIVGKANKGYLDAARAAGLSVLAAPNTSAGPKFNASAARQAIEDYDAHPALWAWYLVDEPDFNEVPPKQVVQAHRFMKHAGARKPTALVLFQGYNAFHFANLADITMIDRYPIPWLPLASFGQHVTMTRLALGKDKPLIAVLQAFDWNSCPEQLLWEKNFRYPTYEEMRCMTYEALARGANGLFYFAFDGARKQPETWEALKKVVIEVNERLPLFQARPLWWAKNHCFGDPAHRYNAALESSVTSTLLRVSSGNDLVPPGDYIVAVNNTERRHEYSFALPSSKISTSNSRPINVVGEGRSLQPAQNRLQDAFEAYAAHIYGPLP